MFAPPADPLPTPEMIVDVLRSLVDAARAEGRETVHLRLSDVVTIGAVLELIAYPLIPTVLPPGARTSDPDTSHEAAAAVSGTPTARNHMGRLLLAYLRQAREYPDDANMTSEEAARVAIPSLDKAEFAKRCSDLVALGHLQVARDTDGHERTRQGRSGRQRLVFELTDKGRRTAEGIEVRAL
jgi:hypothetical protein